MKRNKNGKKRDGGQPEWDDGRTVSPMTAGWMPWNVGDRPPRERRGSDRRTREGDGEPRLSRAERRGLLRGMLLAYLPAFLCVAVTFVLLWIFARLWLG